MVGQRPCGREPRRAAGALPSPALPPGSAPRRTEGWAGSGRAVGRGRADPPGPDPDPGRRATGTPRPQPPGGPGGFSVREGEGPGPPRGAAGSHRRAPLVLPHDGGAKPPPPGALPRRRDFVERLSWLMSSCWVRRRPCPGRRGREEEPRDGQTLQEEGPGRSQPKTTCLARNQPTRQPSAGPRRGWPVPCRPGSAGGGRPAWRSRTQSCRGPGGPQSCIQTPRGSFISAHRWANANRTFFFFFFSQMWRRGSKT